MGELRTRRPPAVPPQALGRSGTVINGHDPRSSVVQRADEESLREEEGHLRRQVATLKKESAEVKERLKVGERESLRKDKLLQELLTTAHSSVSVPGEALDQLREDLQVLLQLKRRAQESRQSLEEREQKIAGIQTELRAIRVMEMEEDVAAAKMEAKAKVHSWAEANAGSKDTHCFTASQQHQQTGKSLITKITEAENSASTSQRRLTTLQDERTRLEKAVEDHREQILKLESKRSQIEQQKEEEEEKLDGLSDLAEQHAKLRLECNACYEEVRDRRQEEYAEQLRNPRMAKNAGGTARSGSWEVNRSILAPGFQPVADDPSAGALLWRFRRAVEAPAGDHGQDGWRSAWELLDTEDRDKDGCINATELTEVLQRLKVPGGDIGSTSRLIASLNDSLVKFGSLVPTVDLALALPLQSPPSCPAQVELESAVEALAWACRRRQFSEQDLRRRVGGWLESSSTNLEEEAMRLSVELGFSNQVALTLGRGLEARREGFARLLPSWRVFTPSVRAATLARFLRDVATYRDTVAPLLSAGSDGGPLAFHDFLQACTCLGSHWSRDLLEHVALLAETGGGPTEAGAPPFVDGPRLVRAAGSGGLTMEFPEMAALCSKGAKEACDTAASYPSRRPGAQRPGSAGRAGRPAAAPVATPVVSDALASSAVAPTSPVGVVQMPPTSHPSGMSPTVSGINAAASPSQNDPTRGGSQLLGRDEGDGLPSSPGASAAASMSAAAAAVSSTPKGPSPQSPEKAPAGRQSPSEGGDQDESYDEEFDDDFPEESGSGDDSDAS